MSVRVLWVGRFRPPGQEGRSFSPGSTESAEKPAERLSLPIALLLHYTQPATLARLTRRGGP